MYRFARIDRWVFWWFYVGVACGAIMLPNILLRDLSRTQDKLILLIGVAHWLLGGLVCYGTKAIRIEQAPCEPERKVTPPEPDPLEWHAASDFLLPSSRRRP